MPASAAWIEEEPQEEMNPWGGTTAVITTPLRYQCVGGAHGGLVALEGATMPQIEQA